MGEGVGGGGHSEAHLLGCVRMSHRLPHKPLCFFITSTIFFQIDVFILVNFVVLNVTHPTLYHAEAPLHSVIPSVVARGSRDPPLPPHCLPLGACLRPLPPPLAAAVRWKEGVCTVEMDGVAAAVAAMVALWNEVPPPIPTPTASSRPARVDAMDSPFAPP